MRYLLAVLGTATLLAGGGMVVSATRAEAPAKAATAPADAAHAANTQPSANAEAAPRAWDFRLTAIDGKPLPMEAFRGKVVLLVNTASMCGFTPQYEGLQKLQDEFGDQGFTVLGVPSGDFQNQEFDSNREISTFCQTKFHITFPLAEKSHVKGKDALPIYQWAAETLDKNNRPEWNFHKFLIGRDGRLIAGFPTRVAPEDGTLKTAIRKAIGT